MPDDPPVPPVPPAHLGRFRVVRSHARGGVGEVSLAVDEVLHRPVALKQLRAERRDDPVARQRFLNEAEVTALLDHPGVVPVYALERDTSGEPFYAMRFVEGRTLQDGIDAYHSSPTTLALHELLRRFIVVCQTLAFAHNRGVIHRDLKPANILLGEFGETVVIDWGLARRLSAAPGMVLPDAPGDTTFVAPPSTAQSDSAPTVVAGATGRDLSGATCSIAPSGDPAADELTRAGAVLGTPAYMPPEQAAGQHERVGPAADVYALGAILRAILTGRPPYRGDSGLDVLQQVLEKAPPPPRQVRRGVPPALEAVCLKAMARDPVQRYASATDLAHDVERWLADEPVSCYREPPPQRAWRWFRRRRLLVTAVVALVLAALPLLGVVAWISDGARRRAEADEADLRLARNDALEQAKVTRRQAERTRRILRFMEDHVFAAARPRGEGLGKDVSLAQALDEAAPRVREVFAGEPEDEATVSATLAETYQGLGRYPAAERLFCRALRLREGLFGLDDERSLEVFNNLALVYKDMGRFVHAEAMLRDCMARHERLSGKEANATLTALNNVALCLDHQGRRAEAERLFRSCLAVRQRVLRANHPHTLTTQMNLAVTLQQMGKLDEAEALLRAALAALGRERGAEHPETLTVQHNLAITLFEQRKHTEARALGAKCLAVRKEALGPDHPHTLTTQSVLANHERERGDPAGAERLERDVLERSQRTLGPTHPTTLLALNNLALTLNVRGQFAEAEKLYRQCLAGRVEVLGPEHPHTLVTKSNLASALADLGQPAGAAQFQREVLEVQRRTVGRDHVETLTTLNNLGLSLHHQGLVDEAARVFGDCLSRRRRVLGTDHPHTLVTQFNLGGVRRDQGQPREAEKLERAALFLALEELGPEHPTTLLGHNNLAVSLSQQKKHAAAAEQFRTCLEGRRRVLGPEHPHTLQTQSNLAIELMQQRQYLAAANLLRASLLLLERTQGADHPVTLHAAINLGECCKRQKQLPEAARHFARVLAARQKQLGPNHASIAEARDALLEVRLYQRQFVEAGPLVVPWLDWQRSRMPADKFAPVQLQFGEVLRAAGRWAELEKEMAACAGALERLGDKAQRGSAVLASALWAEALLGQGKASEAEALLRKVRGPAEAKLGAGHWLLAHLDSLLGASLSAQGRHEEAKPLVVGAYDRLRAGFLTPRTAVRGALERVVRLYEAWGQPERAAEYRARLTRMPP